MKTKELARALAVPADRYRGFRALLQEMESSGAILRVRGQRYALPARLDLVTGSISLSKDGHGFVRPERGDEDVYVPARRLSTAMDGDRVAVRIEGRRKGRLPEGTVVRVIERARATVVGVLHHGKKFSWITPLDARMRRDVLLTEQPEEGAPGDVVVARLTSYGEGRVGPTGIVESVLGSLEDPGVDVLAVAYGHGLRLDFAEEVRREAEESVRVWRADPGPDRVDRTDLLTFTIDPADAKDHDDALSVQRLEGGRFEVGVHIADVSHFVRPGSLVDGEAQERGTSVYLVDRTIPMLPRVLSNEVCSLQEGEDRFAVSLFMVLDRDARLVDRRYERTTIHCRRGLSYEEVQAVLEGAGHLDPATDDALRMLDDVARAVRAERAARGSLDLGLPEAKVMLDDQGKPVDVVKRERLESHRLIEDFMVLANEVVARDLEARGLHSMYRIHEPPSGEKVEELRDIVSRFGIRVPRRKSLKPEDVQRVLEAAAGRQEEALVSQVVLRSLQRARYHVHNVGHFGLASSAYTHFTSPIRRYPDLVVHRVLTSVLVHGEAQPWEDEGELAELADRCSAREQAAAEAERASVALKKVEFMEQYLGDDFAGRVSGVAAFGFFVTLDDFFVDGLVHVGTLDDDYYHFHEREYVLKGERRGRSFRLGDAVRVQVVRVDKEARHVDFALIDLGKREG